jgi:hypothetical protein
MARRRIKQGTILVLGVTLFVMLLLASLTQARNEMGASEPDEAGAGALHPASVMKVLMTPAGSPKDKCILQEAPPPEKKCRAFIKIDEDVLQDIFQNYTKCLEDESYYINFSNQPEIKLSRPLRIYGRTSTPLTINGLRVAPSKSFPRESPAIIIIGKPVNMEDVRTDGFETGIMDCSG